MNTIFNNDAPSDEQIEWQLARLEREQKIIAEFESSEWRLSIIHSIVQDEEGYKLLTWIEEDRTEIPDKEQMLAKYTIVSEEQTNHDTVTYTIENPHTGRTSKLTEELDDDPMNQIYYYRLDGTDVSAHIQDSTDVYIEIS